MAQANSINSPDIIGKISLKTVGGNPALAAALKADVPMMRIWGTASNVKVATGQDGAPVFGLAGNFMARNVQDGKFFKSGVAYLPGGIQELIQEPLEQALAKGEKVGIEFALDVFSIPSTNKAGYSFRAESLTEVQKDDPMLRLAAELDKREVPKFPALPEPEKK